MSNLAAAFVLGVVTTLLTVMVLSRAAPTAPKSAYGSFVGDLNPSWLDDGRQMKLNADFAYRDPKNKIWLSPAGSVIDGASIPRALWTVFGGPFEGAYRNASVVHDTACVARTEPSADVHRMFYFACRCGGVTETKAKAMYYAVNWFGPRWKEVHSVQMQGSKPWRVSKAVDVEETREMSRDQAEAIQRYFETHNPDLDEIEKLGPIPAGP